MISELESTKYPNICACLGRKGVEEALRKEMANDLVRMVCQSPACIDGGRTGDVYTFTPSPPCAPINICKPGMDVNAAKVTMSNVTFNCNFDKDTPSTSQTVTPPGSSTPGSEPPPDAAPSTDAVSPSPPTKAPLSKKTKIVIGAAAGTALLILVIIVAIIVKTRKSPTSE